MKCPHCGQEHPDGFKFCPETGKKMEFELLSCSNPECVNFGKHILPKDSKFCPDCGTKLNVENEQTDDFVDLGLSVKWTKCNLGAKSPEGYGNYYAWGETESKGEYTKENNSTYGKSMSCIAGNPQYDAATAALGQGGRLPTWKEMIELVDKCSTKWTTHNGVRGRLVTGPNGNSIFLPAASYRLGTLLYYAGEYGYDWCSTPYEDYDAYRLDFDSGNVDWGWNNRYQWSLCPPVREIKA